MGIQVMEEAGQTVPPKLIELGGHSNYGGNRKRNYRDDNRFGNKRPSSNSSYQSGPSAAKRAPPSGGSHSSYNQGGGGSGGGGSGGGGQQNWGGNSQTTALVTAAVVHRVQRTNGQNTTVKWSSGRRKMLSGKPGNNRAEVASNKEGVMEEEVHQNRTDINIASQQLDAVLNFDSVMQETCRYRPQLFVGGVIIS